MKLPNIYRRLAYLEREAKVRKLNANAAANLKSLREEAAKIERKADKSYDAIQARVRKAVGRKASVVVFSVYPYENDIPVDNLDEIACEAPCQILLEDDGFFGDGRTFRSRVLKKPPTWLRICVVADRAMFFTGDLHHRYVEGLQYEGKRNGVLQYRLVMGS